MRRLLRTISLAGLLLLAINRLPAQISFVRTPPVLLPAGGLPVTAVADFTGDGIPDVLAATAGGISVYPGNGDGTFKPMVFTSITFGEPSGVAYGDFNNDGHQDLVLAAGGPLLLFLGNGDGSFQSPSTIASGSFPVVGNFNGDKNLDLVFSDGGNVDVFLGNGAGGFTQSAAIPVSSAGGIAVGQLNGDHKLDLAVTNPLSDTVSVYLGNGDGTFGSPKVNTVGLNPNAIAIRDLNGDGKSDIAVGDAGSSDIAVLLGNGDGTFQPNIASPVPGSPPYSLVVGDFNNDGIPDIALFGYILLGTGSGTFQAPVTYPSITTYGSVVAADLNGDRKLDLVVTGSLISGTSLVSILLGKGHATFRGAPDISVGTAPSSIAVADFNGDGIPDFVTANSGSGSLSVALGAGHGKFSIPMTVSTGFGPSAVAAGDFNGDGKIDLVAGCNVVFCLGSIFILLGDGTGSFQAPVAAVYGVPGAPIVVGDVNNDGKLDLVVPGWVILGNGDGTFQAPAMISSTAYAQSLALGDFNGDGKLDLAAGQGSSLMILLGNGDGTFTPDFTFSVGNGTGSIVIADLNGDHNLDIATGGNGVAGSAPNISIFLGNGNGTFQAEREASAVLYPVSGGLIAADFNLDGKIDLAALTFNSVSILPGNGDGTFQPPQIFAVDGGPTGIVSGGKGAKPSLLVSNGGSNTVSILVNNTP